MYNNKIRKFRMVLIIHSFCLLKKQRKFVAMKNYCSEKMSVEQKSGEQPKTNGRNNDAKPVIREMIIFAIVTEP